MEFMIKKHPMNRAERLLINEKKKRSKRGSSEDIPNEFVRALSPDFESRGEDLRFVNKN